MPRAGTRRQSGAWVTWWATGAQPNEVIERLREVAARWVIGNHDAAALGLISTELFNSAAKKAAAWTEEALTDSSLRFLGELRETEADKDWTFVHGTFADPL